MAFNELCRREPMRSEQCLECVLRAKWEGLLVFTAPQQQLQPDFKLARGVSDLGRFPEGNRTCLEPLGPRAPLPRTHAAYETLKRFCGRWVSATPPMAQAADSKSRRESLNVTLNRSTSSPLTTEHHGDEHATDRSVTTTYTRAHATRDRILDRWSGAHIVPSPRSVVSVARLGLRSG